MTDVEMETAFQLLARLSSRPSLENLYPILFKDGPHQQQVIELSGYSSSGKTFLITEIIAKCILPECFGGKNCGVILINTDHHFSISNLVKILEIFIKQTTNDINFLIKEVLSSFIVLNCFDSQQFYVTFQKLDSILSANRRISAIIVDSILAYYWCDRLNGGIKKMENYQKTILRTLQNITKEHKVVIIYTKTTNITKEDSNEECKKVPTLEKINYKINLLKCDKQFSATITFPDKSISVNNFRIKDVIEWL